MQLFDLIINNINFKVKRKIRRVEEKLKEGSEEKKRFRYRAQQTVIKMPHLDCGILKKLHTAFLVYFPTTE